MTDLSSSTRRRRASHPRLMLVLVGCLLLYCLERATPRIADQGGTATMNAYEILEQVHQPVPVDCELFTAVIARLRDGESYYPAMVAEMENQDYLFRNIFQVRPPWLICTLAWLPDWVAWALLAGIGVAACALLAWRGSWANWAAAVLVATGPLALLTDRQFALQFELWTGLLILLSAAAYFRELRWLGVTAGLLALVCRELALPYVALRVWWAWREHQVKELVGWALGLAILGAMWIVHCFSLPPHAGTALDHWLQFGGIPQILTMIRQASWLLIHLPVTFSGFLLFGVVAGLFGSLSKEEKRTTIVGLVFLVFFACISHRKNFYWGLTAEPLWCLAAASGVAGLKSLFTSKPGNEA